MRVIERHMIQAINLRKDWRSANTEVRTVVFPHADAQIDRISVYLHGNKIAEITPESITINNCGWQSPTTKSRLNAIFYGLNLNARISQKNHQWYLYNWSDTMNTIEMTPGEDYTITR